jgi:hypothetical protein
MLLIKRVVQVLGLEAAETTELKAISSAKCGAFYMSPGSYSVPSENKRIQEPVSAL